MTYEQPKPEIHGWMNQDELDWLFETAQQMKSVAEVGSWRGRSTHCLLTACQEPVIAVDHWRGNPGELGEHGAHHDALTQDIFSQFRKNVGHFANLRALYCSSADAAALVQPVDMVFIDANHDKADVVTDLKAWLPKTKKILSGHDYPMPGVNGALKELDLDRHVQHPPRARGIWFICMERLHEIAS